MQIIEKMRKWESELEVLLHGIGLFLIVTITSRIILEWYHAILSVMVNIGVETFRPVVSGNFRELYQ